MSSIAIYPQVGISYGAQGARKVLVLSSAVRKKILDRYYFVIITTNTILDMPSIEKELEFKALSNFHEVAYQAQFYLPYSVLSKSYRIIADEDQSEESHRLAAFYGIGVPAKEELEYDAEGNIRVKVDLTKAEVPKKPIVKKPRPVKVEEKQEELQDPIKDKKPSSSHPGLRKMINKGK